ncbi:Hypothetical predicted protein [Olea europaea subsp. europaea]|uniref:Uncharacterized protein n=1 Tax=Olea europaea subsp. europaea TaxID=158383 RepID=A0A8S0QAC4_OLEEU|nr:Hypothetical predicted protein [Olea europaea subsp. europaea]
MWSSQGEKRESGLNERNVGSILSISCRTVSCRIVSCRTKPVKDTGPSLWHVSSTLAVSSFICSCIAAFCRKMVLTFAVTVANSLVSLPASLGLLLEPLLQWQTAEVADSGSWIIGALCGDASSPKCSLVFLSLVSSFVELMATLLDK